MKTFTLILQDATRTQTIADVSSFVGEDVSGSFGILAGHARMMTSLIIGLARFREGEDSWKYLALPSALLYFRDDHLTLSTRRFMLNDDFMEINAALQQQLVTEEEQLRSMKESLRRMEEEMLKRLWEMSYRGGR